MYDDAFWTKGTHSIKFGIAAERMLFQATALSDPNGVWYFPNLPAFLTNISQQISRRNRQFPHTPRSSPDLFGGYIQDDWRLRKPNLTLNLGLRYEMTTVPTETHGKLVNLRNLADPLPVAAHRLGELLRHRSFFQQSQHKEFRAAMGFAWDPFSNGKLAVRGGAGFFDVLPLPYQFTLLATQAAPFFQYTALNVGQLRHPSSFSRNDSYVSLRYALSHQCE